MDYEESEIIGNEGVSLYKTIHPHFFTFSRPPSFAEFPRSTYVRLLPKGRKNPHR
ncbi:MAG: hypothetical protein IJT89_02515 [Bacteroidaceae bacterium]|nr:hypothetical protein [Bacteroidaceae bacterium]